MSWTPKSDATGERANEGAAVKRALMSNPSMAKAGAALASYETGMLIYERVKGWYNNRTNHRVTIDEDDPTYDDVHAWFTSVVPDAENRQLKVLTADRRRGGPVSYEEDAVGPSPGVPELPPMRVVIDDDVSHALTIGGHKVRVSITKPDLTGNGNKGYDSFKKPQQITFEARSPAAQRAVVDHIESLRRPPEAREPVLMMTSAWGSWRKRSDVPKRKLESIFLPAGQTERIRDDIADFLSREARYEALGSPYHRSYMLEGPPGTGKTSLVKGLATYFKKDLWYIPLADLENESSLMNLIAEVRPGSFLLLEDVDTLKVARKRSHQVGSMAAAAAGEGQTGGLTTGSLLNALDGVATPHGLITFMTTNDFGGLDEALTRAGRMDRIEHIGLPDAETLCRMFQYFYGVTLQTHVDPGVSQAEIAEIFKRNLDDPYSAAEALPGLTMLNVR